MTDLGRHVFGLAAVALGLIGLSWGDFSNTWQPVPEDAPARTALAYAAAALFLLSGLALQWRRSAPIGALVVAALSLVFAACWGVRVAGYPQILGTWLGFAEQVALVIAALVVFASLRTDDARVALFGRLSFGACLLVFGAAHFVYVPETSDFVPAWIPPSQSFWALATGAAHVAAGLAFLSGILAPLAGRLLTLMFIGFGLLVWAPQIIGKAPDHMAIGGNAMNLALIGAAWVLADVIAAAAGKAPAKTA